MLNNITQLQTEYTHEIKTLVFINRINNLKAKWSIEDISDAFAISITYPKYKYYLNNMLRLNIEQLLDYIGEYQAELDLAEIFGIDIREVKDFPVYDEEINEETV